MSPSSIVIHNHESGSVLGYSLVRLFGQCPSSTGNTVFVTCSSVLTGRRKQYQVPVRDKYFKALILLDEGENDIQMSSKSSGNSDLHFKLSYNPNMINVCSSANQKQSSKIKGVWFVCKDGDGSFRNLPHEKNDINEAIKRMQIALLMMQTFCAEKVQDGLRTFPLEMDPKQNNMPLIEVVHSNQYTREQFASLSNDWIDDGGSAAYCHIHDQLVTRKEHTPNTVYYCITSGHYYDPVQNKTRLGAALGGGYLGMWSDVNMYSYPNSVEKIVDAFMNNKKVDKSRLRDDSGGRGTYHTNCATGIGASMHELGHCFGCDHTPTGIMARGFDHFNLFFCVKDPDSDYVYCPLTTEEGAMWHDSSIETILKHHLFKKECLISPNGPRQSKPTTVVGSHSTGLSIVSAAYGPQVVTEKAAKLAKTSLNIGANNKNFNDSLPGWPKSLSMVVESEGDYFYVSCIEGKSINMASKKHIDKVDSSEKIICFTYGPADMTQKARSMVSKSNSIHVSHRIYGDTWPNVLKSFMLVYRSDNGKIKTIAGMHDEVVKLD